MCSTVPRIATRSNHLPASLGSGALPTRRVTGALLRSKRRTSNRRRSRPNLRLAACTAAHNARLHRTTSSDAPVLPMQVDSANQQHTHLLREVLHAVCHGWVCRRGEHSIGRSHGRGSPLIVIQITQHTKHPDWQVQALGVGRRHQLGGSQYSAPLSIWRCQQAAAVTAAFCSTSRLASGTGNGWGSCRAQRAKSRKGSGSDGCGCATCMPSDRRRVHGMPSQPDGSEHAGGAHSPGVPACCCW